MSVPRRVALGAAMASAALVTAACGGGGSGSTTTAAPATTTATAPTPSAASSAASNASGPVGPGCAGYTAAVPSGKGSVEGMAADPVAVAASNNPLLKTLVAAVSGKLNPKVNLVDTLDGGQFTVFAPVDTAFAKVPKATISKLSGDQALLTSVLTYHVLPGQITPDQIVGVHKTVEGGTVMVTGTPAALKVNGANVICGGVRTANATVYLIDGVLSPRM